MTLNSVIDTVTEKVRERSQSARADYEHRLQRMRDEDPPKQRLSCGNLAHGYAACNESDKQTIRLMQSANLGIINSYNDVLSAHQPLAEYPDIIKRVANELGSTAQVAGGVPAMCDGVTQGQAGMELSLFSREVIAMATAISLSHNLFDGALCLGVCDKIVPGMLMGALQFGHIPTGFIPAGPMRSGISNKEKASVRQRYAEGKATKEELLEAESASYHSAGTCTFYGTANTNQVLMEAMGIQLPGASFVNPDDPLRKALVSETVRRVIAAADTSTSTGAQKKAVGLGDMINVSAIMNALVALLSTGGSTNHTLHLVAIARAAGIQLTWQDFSEVSKVVPLLVRVYPNGEEDVNGFQRAGGTAFLFKELRRAGLLSDDVQTLMGSRMEAFEFEPRLNGNTVEWKEKVLITKWEEVLRPIENPFDKEGGMRVLEGNLGEGVIKISAVKKEHRKIKAPCEIFHDQKSLKDAFDRGDLEKDFIAVIRFQGPQANGMPELHQLTPYLGALQDRGFKVALVTDGRMSGASGKIPAAIHLSPEALADGPIGKLKNGDIVELDAEEGILNVLVDEKEFSSRIPVTHTPDHALLGRNLFDVFRSSVDIGSRGASVFKF
ncbi:MAG: phosphogluconate dehydratase [Cellvibrionaceae bacterium]